MIPDYLVFIRYQDKRLIPFIYLIILVPWGFYWKNNAFSLTQQDAGFISGILAIVLFHLIYDLKAYWMYKGAIKNVDLTCFNGKTLSGAEIFLSRPLVACAFTALVCWVISGWGLALTESRYAILGLYSLLSLLVCLVFKGLRSIYIRQLADITRHKVQYRTLYHYVSRFMLMNCALNILTVSPLKNNPDFSLNHGWLSPALTVAMFILCLVVLTINLLFARLSKKYVFLGRLFLREIDFSFSAAVPCAALQAKPLAVRLVFFALLQMLWIIFINALLAWLAWSLPFSLYFFLCYLPASVWYFLHLYWRWHTDYLTACDMYLRCSEVDKRASVW
ncbi:hypothetical protein COO59_01015 [Mixta theicola]|uniref:Uncharacterized protein n=1 Tax=Mixta theicola TaxID=1458355 RepID=A0A2K1QEH8_9GAMM|nr:hypothetical protein [Mixta theicola]PNS13427.1 hypothetical protein COO59_01015 [Mixta theicola]GLR09739.1 hypothetical protein GCM10007905_24590 [Mixta theicola]